jgi:CspA family cold shock protein
MVFRDMLLRCGACGREFVYTVREQRLRQQQGLPTDPPAFCTDCRVADVRLAEAAGSAAVAAPTGGEEAEYSAAPRREARREPAGRPQGQRGGSREQSPPRNRGPRGGGREGGRRNRRPVQTELRIRHVGAVKYFNNEKGYGFIASDDEGEVFVHLSGLLDPTLKALDVGSPVEFEIEHTSRGPQAVDVIPLA